MRRPLRPRAPAPHRPRSRTRAERARASSLAPDPALQPHSCTRLARLDHDIIHELLHHRYPTSAVATSRLAPITAIPDRNGRLAVDQVRGQVDGRLARAV